MITGEVIIHLIRPADLSAQEAKAFLTADERERAARFRFEKDAAHWMACRAAMRRILGDAIGLPPLEVPLITATYGKPVLAAPHDGLHFNLSHCTDLALLAITETGPVGIDLEQKARAPELLECETSFCHSMEIAALPKDFTTRAAALLDIWTAKEAALKALGTGLSHPPESVRILNDAAISDTPLEGIHHLTIHRLEGRDLFACRFESAWQAILRFARIPRGSVGAGNEFQGKAALYPSEAVPSSSWPASAGPLGERSLPLRGYSAALATMGAVETIRFKSHIKQTG